MTSEGASKPLLDPAPERASRVRQRQRLIEACISALHIYGPSRTTVERVVALADLSPGIVRFYFESKAAMLVASLEFLAHEFEQRVMLPVARLKHTPVRALELLVELYLDADIASARKVSVWYSFWGEASSRQEYLEICGRKDDDFATLVRELMGRLIEESGERHLDEDGIALGLIGVLEVLWQNIAFQSEESIDRRGAKRRALNYLRSVFPRQFAQTATTPAGTARAARPGAADRLPAWAYADTALFAAERERLFRPAWQLAGHSSELPQPGDYVALDLPSGRALLLRDQDGALRAFHNTCLRRPHALLVAHSGSLEGGIECAAHGLHYGYDGRFLRGDTPGDLTALEVGQRGGLIFLRPAGSREASAVPLAAWGGVEAFEALLARGLLETELAADWKLCVEQWLESALAPQPARSMAQLLLGTHVALDGLSGTVDWQASLNGNAPGWTAGHYARALQSLAQPVWRRLFVPPNQLFELRPDGALVLQVMPEAPGRCRLRRFEFSLREPSRVQRATAYLAHRMTRERLRQDGELSASIQAGLEGSDYAAAESGPVLAAVAAFRGSVLELLAGLQSSPGEPPA